MRIHLVDGPNHAMEFTVEGKPEPRIRTVVNTVLKFNDDRVDFMPVAVYRLLGRTHNDRYALYEFEGMEHAASTEAD